MRAPQRIKRRQRRNRGSHAIQLLIAPAVHSALIYAPTRTPRRQSPSRFAGLPVLSAAQPLCYSSSHLKAPHAGCAIIEPDWRPWLITQPRSMKKPYLFLACLTSFALHQGQAALLCRRRDDVGRTMGWATPSPSASPSIPISPWVSIKYEINQSNDFWMSGPNEHAPQAMGPAGQARALLFLNRDRAGNRMSRRRDTLLADTAAAGIFPMSRAMCRATSKNRSGNATSASPLSRRLISSMPGFCSAPIIIRPTRSLWCPSFDFYKTIWLGRIQQQQHVMVNWTVQF